MRIVGLDEFLSLPSGTVFAKYRPQIFDELCVKGDSINESSDFFYRPVWEPYAYSSSELHDVLVAAEERKEEVQIDTDCWQRDGLFEYEQLFAVFSSDEVVKIAESMATAAKGG